MRRPNYTVLTSRKDFLILQDVGPWDQFPTITNGAEQVVKECHEDAGRRGKRILYVDSEGELSELVHDFQGKFVDFRFV
jgi:hypothetical protein